MPIKYIPYGKQPVKGQAILNNIPRPQRVLRYEGNDKVFTKILRGMPYYEVETREKVGNDSKNLMLRGECLTACAHLKQQNINVDLVYIDPPFASGANYAKKIYLRQNTQTGDAKNNIEGDTQGIEQDMYGDIWNKEEYLNWMYENLMAIKEVMSDTASIYMHLDWNIGHYVKILMDEIFGEENFKNEIVWCYHGPGSPNQQQFTRKHHVVFWYSKTEKCIFNSDDILTPYHPTTANKFKSRGTGFAGDASLKSGKIPEDWWVIPVVSRVRTEILDYPTQKPEALLKRIIQASSNEGMIVADFFGGSGVTAKVAHDLKRTFIHCDVGDNSIQTARDRLMGTNASFTIQDVKDGVRLYRNPAQTMKKLSQLIDGLITKLPEGINASDWFGVIHDSKSGVMPVFIPNLTDSSHKVLDEVAINDVVNGKLYRLQEGYAGEIKRVIIYYVDIENEDEIRKFINDNNKTMIDIELRDLKMVLDFVVDEDYIEYRIENGGILKKLVIVKYISDRMQQIIDIHNKKSNLINNKKFVEISASGLELIEYISIDCTNDCGTVWKSDTEMKIKKDNTLIIDGNATEERWDGTIECPTKTTPKRLKIRNIAGDETIINIFNDQ